MALLPAILSFTDKWLRSDLFLVALTTNGRRVSESRQPTSLQRYGCQKVRTLEFFTEFSSISFFLYVLMEVFPCVFYHFLKPVASCFEGGYESFLCDFVENIGGRAF
jgi:hypothetical protein